MAPTIRLAGSALPADDPRAGVSTRPLRTAERRAPGVVTVHLREAGGDTVGVALARQQHTPGRLRRYPSALELAATHRAHATDVAAVSRWADGVGLRVRSRTPAHTALDLSGSLDALARAFDVELEVREVRDAASGELTTYRDHRGELGIPARLEGMVTAVLGLSERPVARPHLTLLPRGVDAGFSHTPEQLAQLYDFPVLDRGGAGMRLTVGIAELGGAVYRPDLAAFVAGNPRLRVIEEVVHGWGPISDPFGPDTEVALDWQVIAGALAYCAPQADIEIVLKYAPNTERGFTNLEASFATDGRDYLAVSTSWGSPEDLWTPTAMDAMERAFQTCAVRGIPHTVAAGDNGSADARPDGREHADHPASAPHAVGCGGTRLITDGGHRVSEEAWNEVRRGQGATGGGVSEHFAVPRYQSAAGIRPVSVNDGAAGRGVPDVAGNADPLTGYRIHHRGTDQVVGGTSAVAPLWAALLGAVSAQGGHRLGDVLPGLYAARDVGFVDVVTGDNGAYRTATGWDPCTGLGAPSGRKLAEALGTSLVVRTRALAGAAPGDPTPDRGRGLD